MTLDRLLKIRTTRENALRAKQRALRAEIETRRNNLGELSGQMAVNREAWRTASREEYLITSSRPLQSLKHALHLFYRTEQRLLAEERATHEQITALETDLAAHAVSLKENLRSQEKLSLLKEELNVSH
ncbi:hypothetical protein [Cupriavidus pampae]|uniref:Type III secretion protein n=1 Tax=Cupriavidus pampae TaxID=659251 RepID=A0ABN7ZIV0_9BURK|nr:hypothetical protein [Cupriavidus pampae]CAG9185923.1 hypothetical protein LMG32289_06163 [Cupriavidus pampae]